jgi:hypothetical protein
VLFAVSVEGRFGDFLEQGVRLAKSLNGKLRTDPTILLSAIQNES